MRSRVAELFAAALLLACQPEIGDPCHTTADCITSTDRICDATQPGGYCTVFNCEPDRCPEGSACVAFREFEGAAGECQGDHGNSRLQRTFCMKACSRDSDCRSGYACIDFGTFDADTNPWSAQVIDARSSAVCALPYSGPAPGDPRVADVCVAPPTSSMPATAPDAAAPAAPLDAAMPAASADAAATDGGS